VNISAAIQGYSSEEVRSAFPGSGWDNDEPTGWWPDAPFFSDHHDWTHDLPYTDPMHQFAGRTGWRESSGPGQSDPPPSAVLPTQFTIAATVRVWSTVTGEQVASGSYTVEYRNYDPAVLPPIPSDQQATVTVTVN
jgi:hypothetical protein